MGCVSTYITKDSQQNYIVCTAHGEQLEHPPLYEGDNHIYEDNNTVKKILESKFFM